MPITLLKKTLLAVALLSAASVTAAPVRDHPAETSVTQSVQKVLDRMVGADGLPGAQATVVDRGRQFSLTAGFGDREAKLPMPGANGHMRGASNIKPMVSTVVLQLVGEGKLALDAPVATYLPGVIPPAAGDASKIKVRHLLQHTSGLHNHSEELPVGAGITPYRHFSRQDLLNIGFSKGPDFEPGAPGKWHYSNTGYVVLGMIIEKATGQPWRTVVKERVFDRLGMTGSYFPTDYDYGLRLPHARGYLQLPIPGGGIATADVTAFDPTSADANGAGITTPRDLLRFYTALLGGKLLRPDLLTAMKQTVPSFGDPRFDLAYGLGLGRIGMPCGLQSWGHGGNLEGFQNLTAVVVDPQGRVVRAANVFTNTTFSEANVAGAEDQFKALYAALCPPSKT